MKKMKQVLKALLYLVMLLILLFCGFLIYQSVTEFKPPHEQVLHLESSDSVVSDTLELITWNIGYFGLGADMDFFYEGGTMVMPEREQHALYSRQALERIQTLDSVDFILLQEVDTNSKRSFYTNELNQLQSVLPHYQHYFALNYKAWVPIPLMNPMGRVNAGIATFTKFTPNSVKRYSYNASYSWPTRLFQLKRCYLESRFPTRNHKELVLINTHNSAFDDAALLREQELSILRDVMVAEFEKGNYVIIGGDWNINPPGFDSTATLPIYATRVINQKFPEGMVPDGWIVVYDSLHTTNRYVNIPYVESKTHSTLIDYYILSPNIYADTVMTIPSKYKESDHQPVYLKVWLQ